jgi:hypothetical protein
MDLKARWYEIICLLFWTFHDNLLHIMVPRCELCVLLGCTPSPCCLKPQDYLENTFFSVCPYNLSHNNVRRQFNNSKMEATPESHIIAYMILVGLSEFEYGDEEIFLFLTRFRLVLRPTQPPIQWVPEVLSPEVKRPGREDDHLPPNSAEVKNAWNYSSTPPYIVMAWCLIS